MKNSNKGQTLDELHSLMLYLKFIKRLDVKRFDVLPYKKGVSTLLIKHKMKNRKRDLFAIVYKEIGNDFINYFHLPYKIGKSEITDVCVTDKLIHIIVGDTTYEIECSDLLMAEHLDIKYLRGEIND